MIPVAEAEARIRAALSPLPTAWVGVAQAAGRVLAERLAARRDQPAADISAMDGYAVRAAEAVAGAVLTVEGEAAAGSLGGPALAPGTARRIFTGGLVPDGADTILIQEHAERDMDAVRVVEAAAAGRHIRRRAEDFETGAVLLEPGRRLGARDLGLVVSLGHGSVPVYRRPRVGIAGTGNELVPPGVPTTAAEVPNANAVAVGAAVEAFGAEAVDLGIVRDTPEALAALAERAAGLDLLVTTGGASVGEHDLVRSALGAVGLELDFWKIAMRPGKPLLFGRMGAVPVLGLPGNPVSALVCTLLFVRVAIDALSGRPEGPLPLVPARLADALPANEQRQDFLRATFEPAPTCDGLPLVRAARRQDSSMLATLAGAEALIVRAPHAPAMPKDSLVKVVHLARLAGF